MSQYTMRDLSCRPPDVPWHWHSLSQVYAGGDSLLSALDCGWTVRQVVHCGQCTIGSRQMLVYYFELQRGDETLVMPVVNNPFVERLLAGSPLEVVVIQETDWSLLETSTSIGR